VDGGVCGLAVGQDALRARDLAYRSLKLNSNSAIALAITAWTETQMGDPEKAIELYRRADRLSPRDPRGWLITAGLSAAHFNCGRFEEAILSAEAALVLNPRFTVALRVLAASLAKLGQHERAGAAAVKLLDIEPQFTLSGFRARMRFLDETPWGGAFLEALRLAGLPE
jgi:tetratricopeptide (TPR) repeat protein